MFGRFLIIFCHFNPPTTRKIRILKKWKKTPEDIIILQICTINEDYMIYGSWDMKRNWHNFFSFWAVFCPFNPLTTQGEKFFSKMKKIPGNIIISHMCTINNIHMMYGSWDTECDREFFILDQILPFYPPNNLKNKNFVKMKKYTWRYYHFTHVYHKWQSYYVWFLRNGVRQTTFCHFQPLLFAILTPPKTRKIKILKKWKKHQEILSLYKCVP